MALSLHRGIVTAVGEDEDGCLRLEVDGRPCIAYPTLTGPVAVNDDVLVNVQARELELGSGGFDVLYANLTRGLGLSAEAGAHVMSLPYTPLQHAVRHVEEGARLPADLAGMPVVCCSLHSQVAPVAAGLGHTAARVAYVQLGGGALPVALSDALRALKRRRLVVAAVAVAPCFGGDAQCVTAASAFAWARGAGFDAVVCGIGPGIVGTGSRLGHGGLAAAHAANTAAALGGIPVLAIRVSEADERERHLGASHHARAALELCLGEVRVAWPAGMPAPSWLDRRDEVEASGWREACAGLLLEHMGRGPDDDPSFFASAFAAGCLGATLVR